ncbi:OmpA family protein [Psychroserpens mesophilus]|uniref:OmpA family protein n=1 Tax=Psychroserpens mesophilus TaxID=325473 RepID=UPI003D650079
MYYRLLLMVFCFSHMTYSQESKLKKANKLFLERAYVKAASIYEEAANDKASFINLADCYYYNGLMEMASNTYVKASNYSGSEFSEDTNFRFAHALYGAYKVKMADSIMSMLHSKRINTEHFISALENGVPYVYDVKKIKSGSNPGDFGMNFFGEQVIFASSRENTSKHYTWNDKPYLDLFKGQLTEEASLINVSPLENSVNSSTHESNAALSKDGKTMYFSRTNAKRHEIEDKKIATVKLFKSTFDEGTWSEAEELPFCSDFYSTQHPALDEEHGRLYFSSDMPNGFGSFDIYYVNLTDGGFGKPVNLGEKINTKHREQFPFFSKENILYFSSNGHQGFGGLDIFMSEQNANNWDTPLNLGETLNSVTDDFSFVVDFEHNKGFLSSNRDGADNLYVFTREENTRTFIVEGTVKDKNSKELLPNTMITLFDENNTAIDSVKVSENGRYTFKTKPNTKYKVEGFKPLYIPKNVDFDTDDSGKIELNIELELESYDDAEEIIVEKEDGYVYIELENIYFDLDKWDIKTQAARTLDVLVNLMKKYPRMEVQLGAHTDNRSSVEYNLELSKNRAYSALDYLISKGIASSRLTAIGYGESQLLVDCGDNCTENEHAVNRRCEFIIVK